MDLTKENQNLYYYNTKIDDISKTGPCSKKEIENLIMNGFIQKHFWILKNNESWKEVKNTEFQHLFNIPVIVKNDESEKVYYFHTRIANLSKIGPHSKKEIEDLINKGYIQKHFWISKNNESWEEVKNTEFQYLFNDNIPKIPQSYFIQKAEEKKSNVINTHESEKIEVSTNKLDLVKELAKLKEQGILTDDEFQKEKEKVLNQTTENNENSNTKSSRRGENKTIKVNNTPILIVVLVIPIILIIIEVITKGNTPLGFFGFLGIVDLFLCAIDMKMLAKKGYIIDSWMVFILPLYLWKRTVVLNQSKSYFLSWIITLILMLIIPFIPIEKILKSSSLSKEEIKQEACNLLTQKLKEIGLNERCNFIIITKEYGNDLFSGVASLTTGEAMSLEFGYADGNIFYTLK